jgi:Asp-tRNA(Asn)/Glu-tRNA(Gln) amidotransferase A subunit family amidase
MRPHLTQSKSRRQLLGSLAGVSLAAALPPAVQAQNAAPTQRDGSVAPNAPANSATAPITVAHLQAAATLAGLEFSAEDYAAMVAGAQQNRDRYGLVRKQVIENDLAPPFYFSPLVPGMKVNRERRPVRFSAQSTVRRPATLEDVAFWSIVQLAQLLKTRQVTSLELTTMYLERLRRFNPQLNCVVTFCDDLALEQARKADREIAAGQYKGLLHGMPWGCKDIIAVRGYKTTWGSGAYRDQQFDEDATVVRLLTDAGAVMLAKLATGELAGGDQWFGGRTNNPWKLDEGSSGSSAGPGSATAAGLVPFAIGTETGGSILSPSARCGCTGLRPTFGRVSRHGAMALSWTQDRLGPICRHVEDCAVVMSVIARPDDLDLSVSELPFNWDAKARRRPLRVGYLEDAFADTDRQAEWIRNDARTLEQLRSQGFELIPIRVPDFPGEVLQISVEAAVFFDELLRSGRDKLLSVKGKADRYRVSRLVPAVEYLQSQRLRSRMMQQLARATEGVEVYLAPSTNGNPRGADGANATTQNKTQLHSQMANLACYPGLALPNGFTAEGTPTSINFMGRPFAETEVLQVAKLYQDVTGFNLKHPPLVA